MESLNTGHRAFQYLASVLSLSIALGCTATVSKGGGSGPGSNGSGNGTGTGTGTGNGNGNGNVGGNSGTALQPGVVVVRRLNRVEYNNTVRDLLGRRSRRRTIFPTTILAVSSTPWGQR